MVPDAANSSSNSSGAKRSLQAAPQLCRTGLRAHIHSVRGAVLRDMRDQCFQQHATDGCFATGARLWGVGAGHEHEHSSCSPATLKLFDVPTDLSVTPRMGTCTSLACRLHTPWWLDPGIPDRRVRIQPASAMTLDYHRLVSSSFVSTIAKVIHDATQSEDH